ncbi:hypothetical protein [Haloglomus litoreum]|uniref:hypothetical protein n=1 Tax=Haloglomus litoreum TaxID=3034026 RepID=UPI0023E79B7B|nr:hypothetical protein [Haloglomus sp. DT116]
MPEQDNGERLSNPSILKSRFEETEAGKRFLGVHRRGPNKVENEYVVTDGGETLRLTTRRYNEEGEVVEEASREWELAADSQHVAESGEPVKVFCQSDHFSGEFFGLAGGGVE